MSENEYTTREVLKALGAVGAAGPLGACVEQGSSTTTDQLGSDDETSNGPAEGSNTPSPTDQNTDPTDNNTPAQNGNSGIETDYVSGGRMLERTVSPYEVPDGVIDSEKEEVDPELSFFGLLENKNSSLRYPSRRNALGISEEEAPGARDDKIKNLFFPVNWSGEELQSWAESNFEPADGEYEVPEGVNYFRTTIELSDTDMHTVVGIDSNNSVLGVNFDRSPFNSDPLVVDPLGALDHGFQTMAGNRPSYQDTHGDLWSLNYEGMQRVADKLGGEVMFVGGSMGSEEYTISEELIASVNVGVMKEDGSVESGSYRINTEGEINL